jgi:hypothetical protein
MALEPVPVRGFKASADLLSFPSPLTSLVNSDETPSNMSAQLQTFKQKTSGNT